VRWATSSIWVVNLTLVMVFVRLTTLFAKIGIINIGWTNLGS
jgi:hypothetical protein